MAWTDEAEALAEACRDSLGVSVTVRRVTFGAMNTTTGVVATTTSDTAVTAIRGAAEIDIAGESRARIEKVRYSVVAGDLAFRPDVGDRIIDGASTYHAVRVGLSVDQNFYEIDTERPLTAQ